MSLQTKALHEEIRRLTEENAALTRRVEALQNKWDEIAAALFDEPEGVSHKQVIQEITRRQRRVEELEARNETVELRLEEIAGAGREICEHDGCLSDAAIDEPCGECATCRIDAVLQEIDAEDRRDALAQRSDLPEECQQGNHAWGEDGGCESCGEPLPDDRRSEPEIQFPEDRSAHIQAAIDAPEGCIAVGIDDQRSEPPGEEG